MSTLSLVQVVPSIITSVTEHDTYRKDQTSAVYTHLSSIPSSKEIISIFMLPCDRDMSGLTINIQQHILEIVQLYFLRRL